MRRAGASLGLLGRLARRRDVASEALNCAPAGVQLGRLRLAAGGSGSTATSGLRTLVLGSFAWSLSQPAINRHELATLPPYQLLQAAGMSNTAPASVASSPRRRGRPSFISKDSEEDIAAAQQRLQPYLQQQHGISRAEAAELAGKLSAKLGAAADQLVPAPLQWLVGRGMQPAKAAHLVAYICMAGGSNVQHASFIRQWPTWQLAFEANWQLADSYLAAYQQQCRESKEEPLKGSDSMAAMLSSMPSRYRLLLVRDLPSKLAALQQGQLSLSRADVGHLIAAGVVWGTAETIAAAVAWLVRFVGSREAAISMLQAAPRLHSYSTATLDGKMAALHAAWDGALQPEQLQQLVQRCPLVLERKDSRYSPAAAALRKWFPQPEQLLAVLLKAPLLLAAPASLRANERWLTGAPLSLSPEEVVALVRAVPQAFTMDMANAHAQHKLALLTQVGGVPLERALSATQLSYLKSSTTALAGRYFLLAEHGVPVPRHKDGGIGLAYASSGLQYLLRVMRRHDSMQRLPADDDAALAYIRRWLDAWPETESGQRWAKPPAAKG